MRIEANGKCILMQTMKAKQTNKHVKEQAKSIVHETGKVQQSKDVVRTGGVANETQ